MNQILGDGTGERIPPPPPSFLLQVDFPVCIHSLKKLDSTFSAGGHLEIEFVCYSWSYVNDCYAGVVFVSLKRRMCCEVNEE